MDMRRFVIDISTMDLIQRMMVDTYIDINVIDKSNNDLLDPNKQYKKSINIKDLNIIYLIDGKNTIYYEDNLDAPKEYLLFAPNGESGKYVLRCFPNSKYPTSTSYLKWSDMNIDTLSVNIIQSNTMITCSKIELNGIKVCSVKEDSDHRLITIVK